MEALQMKPERPDKVLRLGDPSLLHLEMSEAAEHFGVIAPSGRRDRKSGAKKRKQHETEFARLQLSEGA
jgi:DNA (cytosine-5)-methyltransferase 1